MTELLKSQNDSDDDFDTLLFYTINLIWFGKGYYYTCVLSQNRVTLSRIIAYYWFPDRGFLTNNLLLLRNLLALIQIFGIYSSNTCVDLYQYAN